MTFGEPLGVIGDLAPTDKHPAIDAAAVVASASADLATRGTWVCPRCGRPDDVHPLAFDPARGDTAYRWRLTCGCSFSWTVEVTAPAAPPSTITTEVA